MDSEILTRLRNLQEKLEGPSVSIPRSPLMFLPEYEAKPEDVETRLKRYQEGSQRKINSVSQQTSQLLNGLNRLSRKSNMMQVESRNLVEDVREELSSIVRVQNMGYVNAAQDFHGQIRSSENEVAAAIAQDKGQYDLLVGSYQKRADKLISSIKGEICGYKEDSLRHLEQDQNRLYGGMAMVRSRIQQEAKSQKQTAIHTSKMLQELQGNYRVRVDSLEQQRKVFFQKLLARLDEGLQKMFK